jgi:hypothetical protein
MRIVSRLMSRPAAISISPCSESNSCAKERSVHGSSDLTVPRLVTTRLFRRNAEVLPLLDDAFASLVSLNGYHHNTIGKAPRRTYEGSRITAFGCMASKFPHGLSIIHMTHEDPEQNPIDAVLFRVATSGRRMPQVPQVMVKSNLAFQKSI